jgi:hypothetical protein
MSAKTMREGQWGIVSRVRPVEQRYQTFRQGLSEAKKYRRPMPLLNGNNAQRLIASGGDQTFSLDAPDIPEATGPRTWAVDVQVEIASRSRSRSESAWWFLPRRNGRGIANKIFGVPARINIDSLFSVKVRQDPGLIMRPIRPELRLSLPNEDRVIRFLLLRPLGFGFELTDGRISQVERYPSLNDVHISPEGAKLRGLIRLFGSFWVAREYCEMRIWRETFSKMAGRTARYDANFRERVKNRLLKEIQNEFDATKAEELASRMCERVVALVGERLPGVPVDYTELEVKREALAQTQDEGTIVYPAGAATVHDHRQIALSKEELRESVDELVRLNVFRPGVVLHCNLCAENNWYHVDDLRQFVQCSGCGEDLAMSSHVPWTFSLNSLAKRSVSGGALSVLHALVSLATQASSFFYSPSLELFRGGNRRPWREIDLVCVVDGEFVVGEVKEGDFSKKDFEKLAEVAEVIRPDRAAMFIKLDRLNSNVEVWKDEMKGRLQPHGIVGELHALPNF